jgi:hypothetical protein
MRESQMKKIIALAVASAFVAPTFAAEVTVGGELEYFYVAVDGGDSFVFDNDNLITVNATEELPNGMSISGTFAVYNDTPSSKAGATLGNDGTHLALSGPFGKLNVGDVTGAMDSTGDFTDVSPSGGGFAGDGYDNSIRWDLPTFIEGLKVAVSHSPEGGNATGAGQNNGSTADAIGYALTYSMGGASVYYANEKLTNVIIGQASSATAEEMKNSAYGVKYSLNGFMLAYETMTSNPTLAASGDDTEATGVALTYKVGDLLIGGEQQEVKKGSAAAYTDITNVFVEYNLGSNVDVYVVQQDDKGAATNAFDTTRVGIEYNF